MNNIAIILARGGSKRLPRKNIINFHGKPMLGWTIEAALQSRQFSQVLLSTDDIEIAEIGRLFGAEVPFLREEALDDMATSSEATLAALNQAEKFWGHQFDYVTQLMANCPLRNAEDIKNANTFFKSHKSLSQISCFKYGWMNPWWAAKLNDLAKPEYLFPEARPLRSQDLPSLYCPSGAIWIAKAQSLKEKKTFYTADHTFYPLNWISAMDIDDAEDLIMAKALFMVRQKEIEKGIE